MLNSTKRKATIVLIILFTITFVIVIAPFVLNAVGWTMLTGLSWLFSPIPSQPQITYGEFPFELTYSIKGETITIKDVYVCEYEGVRFEGEYGRSRMWNGYIKGTGEASIFITEDADRKIYCSVGFATFYMDDEKHPIERPLQPRFRYETKNSTASGSLSDELLAYYDIEIISWTFSEPIENSFD